MTDVNDLLRRTLAEGEAWKQAAQDRSESYIEDNDTAFQETHEYLDRLDKAQGPNWTDPPDPLDAVCDRLDSLERRATILERDIVALYDGAERKESLKNANSLREAMGDEAYDQAMNAALFAIRLTRLEGVVRLLLERDHVHSPGAECGGVGLCAFATYLDRLAHPSNKEAQDNG